MADKKLLEYVTGLRGLAILLVLVYHLDSRISSHGYNGYLGVEMFFVISGYFLLLGLQHDAAFSFVQFCCKKLKRLFVPLAFLVLMVGLAALLMPAEEMKTAAETGLASLAGVANIWLASSGGGYFDVKSAENPLLHTWYIGALCQMFVVCGLGAVVLKRVPRAVAVSCVMLAGCISFMWGNVPMVQHFAIKWGVGLPVWYTALRPDYYEALPRMWQLLAGGLVILLPNSRSRIVNTFAAVPGLLLIALCLVGKSAASANTVYAVAGTVLLLRFLPCSYLESLFCLRPLKWVGAISFSLYLCHVPLWVYMRRYGFIGVPTFAELAMLLLAVFPVSMLFYVLVERRRMPKSLAWGGYAAAAAMCALLIATNGMKEYLHVEANSYELPYYDEYEECSRRELLADYPADRIPMWNEVTVIAHTHAKVSDFKTSLMQIGDAAVPPTFALIGDSHATSIFPGMHTVLRGSGCSGVFLSCHYVPVRYQTGSPEAEARAAAIKSWLAAHPEIHTVVLSQRWSGYMGGGRANARNDVFFNERVQIIRDLCAEFRGMGKKVILMTEVPQMNVKYPIGFVRQGLIFGRSEEDMGIECSAADYDERCTRSLCALQQMETDGLCRLLHSEKTLRADGVMRGICQGRTLYYDDNHLNTAGAAFIMRALKDDFLQLMQENNHVAE